MFLETWFPTPVWYNDLNKISDEDIKHITNKWISFSENNISRSLSNVGGWQSNDLRYEDCDAQEKAVFEIIQENIEKAILDYAVIGEINLENWWVNINKYSHYNMPHKHPASILSGTLYVKVPKINSGNLVFYREYDDFMLDTCTKTNNKLTYIMIEYPPIEKRLIVFPSWLKHSVKPNMSNEERISISFNYAHH